MSFENLPEPLALALAEKGYAEPTSVQAAVLEPEALGRDLVVSAQTGSGKTIAFGIAMLRELLADGAVLPPAASRALVGDGNFGGDYERSDAEVLAMWEIAVAETRALIEGPWA